MTEEGENPIPPPPAPSTEGLPAPIAEVVEQLTAKVEELETRVDDTEALAHATAAAVAEDDDQTGEPEHTEVEGREGAAAGDKPEDEAPPPPPTPASDERPKEKHAGWLF